MKSLSNLEQIDKKLLKKERVILDKRNKFARDRHTDSFKMPRMCDI